MLVDKFDESLNVLLDCCKYYNEYSYTITKPVWVKQNEQFLSFWTKIKDDDDMVINFKNKVIIPFFNDNRADILKSITNEDGVILDKFLQIDLTEENDITLNNIPRGLFLHINKVYLPVSQIYTETRNLIKKRKDNLTLIINFLGRLKSFIRSYR